MERNITKVQATEVAQTNGQIVAITPAVSWADLIEKFVVNQDVKESSRNTYRRTLTQYFVWTEQAGKLLSEIQREDILQYKEHLQAEGLSNLTVGSYIVAVRKFYEWTEAEKLYPNVARGVKTPRRVQAFKKQHLTDDKSRQLLQHFKDISLRDYAIVNLILRTGLRTIEVVRANVEDITYKNGRRILKVWGKGRDERDEFVVLSDKAWQPIKDYLQTRKGAKGKEPLFTSQSHRNASERLTTRTISGLCKSGLVAIDLDGREYTAHSLRHTTAVAILKCGGNITDVQGVLRHSSPVTSQIYTESIKEELRLQQAPELMLDAAF